MITIIDYGLGNVQAFINVYNSLNIPVSTASRVGDLKNATKVILPGVGSFDNAMTQLSESGMRDMLTEMVLTRNVPVLGVCVGMQMLALSSEEGKLPGLGWIAGEVKKFQPPASQRSLRVPHMGWNTVKPLKSGGIFAGLDCDSRFYFLHSYYFHSYNYDNVMATTDYCGDFDCAVRSGNVFGVQFHPEKSHGWGVRLLENFARVI